MTAIFWPKVPIHEDKRLRNSQKRVYERRQLGWVSRNDDFVLGFPQGLRFVHITTY
jgi:hypothetical protein